MKTGSCYWRFKGEKAYRYGYASQIDRSSLWRMGSYNGDFTGGFIVDPYDVEIKR